MINSKNHRLLGCVGALGLIVAAAALTSGPVGALTAKAVSTDPAGGSAPKGYVFESATFTATNNQQTGGAVACPTGTVTWGGGAVIGAGNLNHNINTSYPSADGSAWNVKVNNTSGVDVYFHVYAVCADVPANYHVVYSTPVDNPPTTQNYAEAVCPKGTVVLGGGAYSASTSTSVNINSSYPGFSHKSHFWNVEMNNASLTDSSAQSTIVCSKKPKGYRIVESAVIDNPSGSYSSAEASCPSKTVAVGGGLYSSSYSTSVNLQSTFPNSTMWGSYENNASSFDAQIAGWAVCAR